MNGSGNVVGVIRDCEGKEGQCQLFGGCVDGRGSGTMDGKNAIGGEKQNWTKMAGLAEWVLVVVDVHRLVICGTRGQLQWSGCPL